MTVKKRASDRSLGSDLDKVDAHVIRPHEYKELPALTEDMLSRAVIKEAGRRVGRPKSSEAKVSISLRLAPRTLARWKATGPGWQTRMAEVLTKVAT